MQCKFIVLIALCSTVTSKPVEINDLPLQTDAHVLDTRSGAKATVKKDPDAITYPDEITRDSYGNPVTPFTVRVDHDVGLMTDVNKDHQLNNRNQETVPEPPKSGFVIPSYANGITKVEIIPNNPNVPKFPLIPPPPKKNQLPSPSSNGISDSILPPYKDDEQRVKYPQLEINTQATIFFPDSDFLNQIHEQNKNNVPKPVTVKAPVATRPTTVPTPITTTTTTTTTQRSNNGDIYTGGFGGAPGLLGNPQPLGIALVNKGAAGAPQLPAPQNIPSNGDAQIASFLNVNLLPPLFSAPASSPDANANNKPVLPVPSTHHDFGTAVQQQQPPPPQQNQHHLSTGHQQQQHHIGGSADTYTGSFGGAPGILRPYDNVPQRQ